VAKSPKPPKPPPKRLKLKRSPWVRLADRLSGAKLCFGEPIVADGTTVIPVARVRTAGGWGWGSQSGAHAVEEQGSGGGGGGWLDAMPLGFIEVGSSGASYHEIPDPERSQRLIRAGAAAVATIAAGCAASRRLRNRRKLLPR
jgi:uncharacterized spore protein YtfJ